MRIGLISCTKSKTAHPAPARELYSPSRLFRGALGYLEAHADRIYVLSAKYGLLPLDEVAAPYDQTLKDETPAYRREWALRVLREIQARHGESLQGITFEFYAGRDTQPSYARCWRHPLHEMTTEAPWEGGLPSFLAWNLGYRHPAPRPQPAIVPARPVGTPCVRARH